MTTVVTSPGGDRVEIVPDAEWAELTGTPLKSVQKVYAQKLCAIAPLWHHGAITDPTGFATEIWHQRAVEYGYEADRSVALSNLFRHPGNEPAVQRQIRGKRTFLVTLQALPETWHHRLREWPAIEAPAAEPEPEPVTYTVDGPPLAPEANGDMVTAVAASLLTQLVAKLAEPAADSAETDRLRTEVERQRVIIQNREADMEALRERVASQADTVAALKAERDGLKRRLAGVEHNLAVAMGSSRSAVGDAVTREFEKLMKEPPAPRRSEGVVHHTHGEAHQRP